MANQVQNIFGGITPGGKVSVKLKSGKIWKRYKRIMIASKLEAMMVPDAEVANHLGISASGLAQLKSTPEFLAARLQHQTGVMSHYTERMLETEEGIKQFLNEMVPTALTAVQHILQNPMHKDHAKVAMDVMDRTPMTSKISRHQHSVEPPKDMAKENSQAMEILGLLDGTIEPNVLKDKPSPEFVPDPVSSRLDPEEEFLEPEKKFDYSVGDLSSRIPSPHFDPSRPYRESPHSDTSLDQQDTEEDGNPRKITVM